MKLEEYGVKEASSSTLVITINTDNAAFEDLGNEVAWILRKAADKIEPMMDLESLTGRLMDSNGNTVGSINLR